jgi:glycosyltransferase involved in cell wall biosynthesis
MNITVISLAIIPSDIANSIQTMKSSQALSKLGNEVTLLVPGRAGGSIWPVLARQYGLTSPFQVIWLRPLPVMPRLLFMAQAVWRARTTGADLVYTRLPQAAVLALLLGLPVVMEIHAPPTGTFGPIWYKLFARLPGQRRVISITHALLNVLKRDFGIVFKQGEAVVGPNGVDFDRFEELPVPKEARRQLNLSEALTVVCTGHLYAGRGVELFVEIARALPEANFLWVGGRPKDVDAWKAKTEEMGIANIKFTGFIPNIELPLFQAAADILLMPYGRIITGSSGGDSSEYCSPMKMFDYLAAGRAIVTSDLPVFHEVLNERNAVFCPPEDTQAWVAAIRGLLDDLIRREALGRQAKADSRQYSWTERAKRALDGFGEK